jgi:hypothetical protein
MPASAAALQEGWKVVEVTRRVLVCRQSVHNWIARYQQRGLTAELRRIERQLARAGVGAVPSRSSIYRCLKRHGLIDLRRRRKRREDFRRWERDRLMRLWRIDVMGGVMLEDGAELKVVTGLDPENGTTGRFFPPAQGRAVRRTWWRGGRRDDLQASRELSRGARALGLSQRSSRQ